MAAATAAWIGCPLSTCNNLVSVPIAVQLGELVTGEDGRVSLDAVAKANLAPLRLHLSKSHNVELPEDAL